MANLPRSAGSEIVAAGRFVDQNAALRASAQGQADLDLGHLKHGYVGAEQRRNMAEL
jgi:hypothetical protein